MGFNGLSTIRYGNTISSTKSRIFSPPHMLLLSSSSHQIWQAPPSLSSLLPSWRSSSLVLRKKNKKILPLIYLGFQLNSFVNWYFWMISNNLGFELISGFGMLYIISFDYMTSWIALIQGLCIKLWVYQNQVLEIPFFLLESSV